MATKMIVSWTILILSFNCVSAVVKLGDPCIIRSGTTPAAGTCKIVYDCSFALNLIKIEQKHPAHCAWQGDTEIVCCPRDNVNHKIGVLRNAFSSTNDGVITGSSSICRYDGSLPATCCPKSVEVRRAPDPPGCPPPPSPNKKFNHVAWTRCMEYESYGSVCDARFSNPNVFDRNYICVSSTLGNKIKGGTPALEREFPHMAILGALTDEAQIAWVSGGSLISDRFILTAAHALNHREHGAVRYALLGTLKKSTRRDGVTYNIISKLVHSRYERTGKFYDIALCELDRRVLFSEYIRPACLPWPGVKVSPERVVAGWGQTEADRTGSDALLKTVIEEFEQSVCASKFGRRGWDGESMICAGGREGQANDSCEGDSGGPMMAYLEDVHCSYTLLGIVSYGGTCGKGQPAVYTKVSHYLDWIVKRVWP